MPRTLRSSGSSFKDGKTDTDSDAIKVNISEVYRVAMDVLIQRLQAKQQADRHQLKTQVAQFKEIMKLIACNLAESGARTDPCFWVHCS